MWPTSSHHLAASRPGSTTWPDPPAPWRGQQPQAASSCGITWVAARQAGWPAGCLAGYKVAQHRTAEHSIGEGPTLRRSTSLLFIRTSRCVPALHSTVL